jgi:hypothetical protein
MKFRNVFRVYRNRVIPIGLFLTYIESAFFDEYW